MSYDELPLALRMLERYPEIPLVTVAHAVHAAAIAVAASTGIEPDDEAVEPRARRELDHWRRQHPASA